MDAIEYFKGMRERLCEEYLKVVPKDSVAYQATLKEKEFYDEAIKALEQEPCNDIKEIREVMSCNADDETKCKMISNILTAKPHYFKEQEPCEDAISRQAAIDAIENEQKKIMRSDWAIDQAKFSAMSEIREIISELPPVSVAEKVGKWIDGHCSLCGCDAPAYIIDWKWQNDMNAKYCPNCGLRMFEPQESEDAE